MCPLQNLLTESLNQNLVDSITYGLLNLSLRQKVKEKGGNEVKRKVLLLSAVGLVIVSLVIAIPLLASRDKWTNQVSLQ